MLLLVVCTAYATFAMHEHAWCAQASEHKYEEGVTPGRWELLLHGMLLAFKRC
jgi:hypothetical protein